MSGKKTIVISLSILLAGAAVILLIFNTEPEATRSGATKETAMLVDVVQVVTQQLVHDKERLAVVEHVEQPGQQLALLGRDAPAEELQQLDLP